MARAEDSILPCPRRGERVLVMCWCGGEMVWVPIEQVGELTGSCGDDGCERGAVLREGPEVIAPGRGRRKAVA